MELTEREIDAWAHAYIQFEREAPSSNVDHPHWWAIEKFMDLIHADPETSAEDCWKAILRVLELDSKDEAMGILAAGPLEDLIGHHGDQFIDRIETESRRNARFRHLLGAVWKSGEAEVWRRIEACRGAPW